MSRQIKRNILKAQYSRFCEAWVNEKRYQDYILKKGEKLEEGHNKLGKKPTFKMWLEAVRNKKMSVDVMQPPPEVIEKKISEKQVEVIDKEW